MNHYQKVGLHVSAAGGVENAPLNALAMKAECFQFFSRSPRGGPAAKITADQVQTFKTLCQRENLESYIHAPYYINFASKNKKIYRGSIDVVRDELARGSQLGVKYVMTHMGSAKDWLSAGQKETPNTAIKQAVDGLRAVFSEGPHAAKAPSRRSNGAMAGSVRSEQQFSTKLLLEISAGAGAVLGDSFEELAALLNGLNRKDVHVCLDTCHLFASGYDMRTKSAIDATMKEFRRHMAISQLKLVHVNDSKGDLADHKDRHEHIGQGKIGAAGFKALLAHPDFQKVNLILETKHDASIESDLAFLKKWRTGQ